MDGLNNDREVLQLEVQRVLQLERQREEELAHAVVRFRPHHIPHGTGVRSRDVVHVITQGMGGRLRLHLLFSPLRM